MKPKVLHVLDMAGIGSIISHYQNLGEKNRSKILYHKKNNLGSGVSEFYEGIGIKSFKALLGWACFESMKYGIIHIHSAEVLVPIFKFLGKKVVLHYHGSDISNPTRTNSTKRIFARSMADMIVYNSLEINQKIVVNRALPKRYLMNPVDTKHFKFINATKTGGVAFISSNLDVQKTRQSISKYDNVRIIDLNHTKIPYYILPRFLAGFSFLVDDKITSHGRLAALSSIGLQALACGLKVYNNDMLFSSLPEEAKPKNTIALLDSYYRELESTKETPEIIELNSVHNHFPR